MEGMVLTPLFMGGLSTVLSPYQTIVKRSAFRQIEKITWENAPLETATGARGSEGFSASGVPNGQDGNHRSQTFRRAQWRMLLVTMFCYLFYYTGRQNFGFVAKALQEDLNLSAAAIGSLSAAMLLAYGIGQAINGGLGDVLGARRLVSMGAFLSVGLNWITSVGNSYFAVLLPWAVNGYAQSFGWAPSCRLITNWWPREERGRAFGLLLLAAGFSSVLTFALCILVLQHLTWRWALRLPVLTLAVGGSLFWLIVRNDPQDAGFATLPADTEEKHQLPINKTIDETPFARYLHVLKNRSFQFASLSIGCESIARYGLLYWVPVHFLGPEWRQDPSSAVITLGLPIGMALGALLTGYMSDTFFRGNPTRLIAILMGLAAIASGLLAVVPSSERTLGFVLLAFAGFFVYGPQAAFWSLCPDLVGRQRVSTAVGVMNASAYAFAAAGEIVIGHVIDLTMTTTSVFYVVPIVCVAGSFLISLVKR